MADQCHSTHWRVGDFKHFVILRQLCYWIVHPENTCRLWTDCGVFGRNQRRRSSLLSKIAVAVRIDAWKSIVGRAALHRSLHCRVNSVRNSIRMASHQDLLHRCLRGRPFFLRRSFFLILSSMDDTIEPRNFTESYRFVLERQHVFENEVFAESDVARRRILDLW